MPFIDSLKVFLIESTVIKWYVVCMRVCILTCSFVESGLS